MQRRLIPALILSAYSAFLVKVMVFKDMPTIRIGQLMLNFGGTDGGHAANVVPFSTIVPYLLGHKGLIIAGVNLVGNIALLVPVGFLVMLVVKNMTWKKSLVLGIAAGLAIEVAQTLLRVGIFDIDDVILNAFGVMIGYWIFIMLAAWVRERKYVHILIAALISIAVPLGVLYAMYPHDQPVSNTEVRNEQEVALGDATFTWSYRSFSESDIPRTTISLTAEYTGGDVRIKEIDTIQGDCNEYTERDIDVYSQSEMIICYYAGLGHYYKVVEAEDAYLVQRRVFEEASPDYNPEPESFETIAEFSK